ncbi:unnamed protein product [Sphagnum tenellum]
MKLHKATNSSSSNIELGINRVVDRNMDTKELRFMQHKRSQHTKLSNAAAVHRGSKKKFPVSKSPFLVLQGEYDTNSLYQVHLRIGKPPGKVYYMEVDTGSTISWLHGVNIWDRGQKSGKHGPNGLYTPVPGGEVHCLNRVCVEARAQEGNSITCLEALQPRCDFKVEYCDGVIIKAVLVKDALSIPLTSQTDVQIMFEFGSSYSHTGYYYDEDVKIVTDGLLGLGPRIGSLNSQLKEQRVIERNAVGQCLSRRDRDHEAGYIFFGTEGVDLDSLAWTPMEDLPQRP